MSATKEIYLAANGPLQMEVAFAEETAWLSQAQMAELFATSADNIESFAQLEAACKKSYFLLSSFCSKAQFIQ